MQKIKNSVFNRIMELYMTRAELDIILYVSHCQDDSGRIIGLYYKEVCGALGISFQTYYDSLRKLEEKGILSLTREFHGDWDICILGNSFLEEKEGYISTGDDLFFDPAFQSMKAKEKLLAMQFLKITKNPLNGGKYRKRVPDFEKKYCGVLGVTRRVLLRYLNKLKQFFSIHIHKGQYYIRPLSGVGTKSEDKPERRDKEIYKQQVSRAVFRRQRASYTDVAFHDTAALLSQYHNILKERTAQFFQAAVEASIRRRNAGIRDPYRWDRELKPDFIHKILLEKMKQARISVNPGGAF